MNVEYITQEILDTIGLMQLNGEHVPILTAVEIDDLATRFLYEWREIGEYEEDVERTLLYFLREEFSDM